MQTRRKFISQTIAAGVGFRAILANAQEQQQQEPQGVLLASKYEKFAAETNIAYSRPFNSDKIRSEQVDSYPQFNSPHPIKNETVNAVLNVEAAQKLLIIGREAAKVPAEQRAHKLGELKKVFGGKPNTSLEAELREGLTATYETLDEIERAQFLQDISDYTGKTAAVFAAAGAYPNPMSIPLEISAAAWGLASVLTNPDSDDFYNDVRTREIAHKAQVWAKTALRKYKDDPEMKEGFQIVGKKYGADLSFLETAPVFDNVPDELRPAFEYLGKNMKAEREISPEDEAKTAKEIHKAAGDQFNAAFANYQKQVAAEQEKQRKKDEDEKLDRQKEERRAGEIEASAYLASFVVGQVFKNPELANGVTKVYQSYALIARTVDQWNTILSDGSRAIGAMVLTGNFVQAFSMLASLAFGGKDATQVALENIQKTLDKVRQEMHERFDEVVKNQMKILDKLSEIGNRVEDLHIKLEEIKAMVVTNDNESRLRDGEASRKPFLQALDDMQRERKLSGTPQFTIQSAKDVVSRILSHAKHTSSENAFTRNDANEATGVKRDWDAKYIRTLFRNGAVNLGYLCGYIPTIHTKALKPEDPLPAFRNIDTYTEAANAFSQAYESFPELRKVVMNGDAAELDKLGQQIEDQYKAAFDKKFIDALKKEVLNSFAAYIKQPLVEAMKLLGKEKRPDGGVVDPDNATLYPFAHPLIHGIKNGEGVPEGIYHNRRISYWDRKENKVVAHVNLAPKTMVKRDFGFPIEIAERLSMSRTSFDMAISYGLFKAHVTDGKKLVDNDTWWRTRYEMKILNGVHKGDVIKNVFYYSRAENSKFKDCSIDVKFNQLAIGKKKFTGLEIYKGVKASDYEAFERYIYDLVGIQHDKVREEYVGKLNESLNKDSDLKAEFEALVSSLCYIAGLSQQLAGNSPEDCVKFAKTAHECLLGDSKSIHELVQELLKPENAPKDKDGNPVKSVEATLVDYLEAKLLERLSQNLDKFVSEFVQERSSGIELLEFRSARSRLQNLAKVHAEEIGNGLQR